MPAVAVPPVLSNSGRLEARRNRSAPLTVGLVLLLWATFAAPVASGAVPTPEQDPFYTYQGSTPLANIAPGTVLKTRTLSYHVAGLPLPVKTVQLLYRSTGEIDQPPSTSRRCSSLRWPWAPPTLSPTSPSMTR